MLKLTHHLLIPTYPHRYNSTVDLLSTVRFIMLQKKDHERAQVLLPLITTINQHLCKLKWISCKVVDKYTEAIKVTKTAHCLILHDNFQIIKKLKNSILIIIIISMYF